MNKIIKSNVIDFCDLKMDFPDPKKYPLTKIPALEKIIGTAHTVKLWAIVGSHARQLAYEIIRKYGKVNFLESSQDAMDQKAFNMIDYAVMEKTQWELSRLLDRVRDEKCHICIVCACELLETMEELEWYCQTILEAHKERIKVIKNTYDECFLSVNTLEIEEMPQIH